MKNIDETYNGYSNWDTFNCCLYMSNNENAYRMARRCKDYKELEIIWKECFEGTDGITTSEVNFEEIYTSINQD